jgi:hypothetical protein
MVKHTEVAYALALVLLACILLVCAQSYIVTEHFTTGITDSRCGVDMAPCTFPLQCMNGYCKSTSQPQIRAMTDLPVLP